jgi:hypothetical protein
MDKDQAFVTLRMRELVIHLFKMIDVNEDDRNARVALQK